MMAAQEYEGMKEQLDLEQNLRVKAETYAHEVKKRSQKYTAVKVQMTHVNTHYKSRRECKGAQIYNLCAAL